MPTRTRKDLEPYQETSIDWIKSHPSCALWVDMGLGKTIAALTAVQDLVYTFQSRYVLVIAPPRVAKNIWPDEIGTWSHINVDYRSIAGSVSVRERLLALPLSTITTISVHNLEWLVNRLQDNWPWDVVIIDEAHYFKSHTTVRFKAFKDELDKIERIIELTGTPAGNGLMDLWAQIWLLDQGERLGHPYSYFRDRYFESDYMGYNWTLRPDSKKVIYDAVDDICISLQTKDYLQLPPLVINRINVQLEGDTKTGYHQLERDFVLELEHVVIHANSAAALTQKLQQYANGAVYDQDGQVTDLHGWKTDALRSVVLDSVGDSILVSYAHRCQSAQIQKLFPKAELINDYNVTRWNQGLIQILICPWSTLGENLQQGGHIVVCFGLTWSLTQWQQLITRLWRQGQDRPVIVHQIVCMGTVDEVMVQAINDKETNQLELLQRVKLQIGEHP